MAIAILALSVVLQLLAAGVALRLIGITRQRAAWLIIALAISLMAGRRAITLGHVAFAGHRPELEAEALALGISLLMLVGVMLIGPLFVAMRSTQDALADSERRYRALFEQSPIAELEHDWSRLRTALLALPDQPTIQEQLAANPGLMADLVGTIEIINVNGAALDLFEAEDRAGMYRRLKALSGTGESESLADTFAAVRRGDKTIDLERNLATLNGNWRDVVIRWSVMPGYEDTYGRVLVSFIDITERKRIQAQLMVADRMASLGTLAAGVAHEINNPLTYILANLQLLKRDRPDVERHTMLGDAIEGAERVREIVRDLQSFSRGRDTETGAVALAAAVDSAARMAQHEIRHSAHLTIDIDDTLYVRADQSRIGQVILNLLVNAAQAIPPGDADNNEIRISAEASRNEVVVTIADTGKGIEPDVLPHIFEPFVTTKKAGRGTGLGLYLCQNIMRSLGGEISVDSQPGNGTSFCLRFPRAEAASGKDTGPVPRIPSSRLSILLVDDEPAIRSLLSRVLGEHDVRVVDSGRAAIAAIDDQDYDLVLCDLMMPDLTGMDVYTHVCEHRPSLKDRMVFLSGGAFTEQSQEFLADPARRHVAKPFRVDEILQLVAEVSRRTMARTAS